MFPSPMRFAIMLILSMAISTQAVPVHTHERRARNVSIRFYKQRTPSTVNVACNTQQITDIKAAFGMAQAYARRAGARANDRNARFMRPFIRLFNSMGLFS
ncbi:hypothetical protein HGRIS_007232 [Hohenbuehelia grisea]|uniref:Uncharacterized protein n=1 Tax=Hohenbuehelia grisea TaxID=104357 RepID=A0ABR3JBG5_9AGAR